MWNINSVGLFKEQSSTDRNSDLRVRTLGNSPYTRATDTQSALRGTEMLVSKSWFHSILKCSETIQKRNCELANKVSKQCSYTKYQAP